MVTSRIIGLLASLVALLKVSANEPSAIAVEAIKRTVPYDEMVKELRTSDAVIAPSTIGHPVSAMYNREAIIPPQCYTRNEQTFNACYVCHQAVLPGRENVMNDDDLQEAYSFSDIGMTNHWKNLFEDRSERVAQITDAEILDYIEQDNYTVLPRRLKEIAFKGWIPDLSDLDKGAAAFDAQGFAKDGSLWVAFNYKPFPSTFWPTNGSTDDVMIRLGRDFRTDKAGAFSIDIYKANLAIVEATIKGKNEITCLPVDERTIGVDLDGDGVLGPITRITEVKAYVGAAAERRLETHLYPADTEFLHTVRYIGITPDGGIKVSRRMKEVRYMKKWRAYPKKTYARQYQEEGFEKEAGHLPGYTNLQEHGLDNGSGWSIAGFIEDRKGRLRTYTFEENFACMGCHGSIGSTIDKTFSLPRKLDGAQGWGYINLKGMRDAPNRGESQGEIASYFSRVGGGSEFRHNAEMMERWFHDDGTPNQEKIDGAKDVYELVAPSRERALMLNKAYRIIVDDQDFIYGKDATVSPPVNVFDRIDNKSATTLPPERQYGWNILLDW